jgi:hypothetical protein
MMIDEKTDPQSSLIGKKRKSPENDKNGPKMKAQKKPWGTDGPPPPEWIAVRTRVKDTNSI